MGHSVITKLTFLFAACCLLLWAPALAGEGGGSIKAGYIYIDEEGNRGVNHETYNSYEGLGISFENWRYRVNNSITLRADLRNLTLNNRNLRLSASKPGRFNISLNNNQYRRSYDFDGLQFTRRRSTGMKISVQPYREITLFGGFGRSDKHGNSAVLLSPVADTVYHSTDYEHSKWNLGALAALPYGFARLEYRSSSFDDRLISNGDRKAAGINLDAHIRVPNYSWLDLSGGYYHRTDEYESSGLELKTNQGWGGFKLHLPKLHQVEYRLLFARTRHTGENSETDNVVNTLAVGKAIKGYGGVRIGYENRISDDLVDRTVSHGLLIKAWYDYQRRLFIKASLATRKKQVKTGATLLGDEDLTRHRVTAQYRSAAWGDIRAQWQGRFRTNDDLNSQVDYQSISLNANLKRSEYGRVAIAYSYYMGKYENTDLNTGFEFADNVISATLYPRSYRKTNAYIGGSYYRSRRDLDTEKFSLNFGVTYGFLKDHELEIKYNVFNFDDYLARSAYYTANIVEINVKKAVSLD
ncbi:MAG: hypothetical protein OEV49_04285 [candidate division Zixibacteria bacterium]|nr:hypothetical protein [candidate division Zixibacteria bacterium]MDH3936187.1 hypothetical protein [candidate division Zixibacteria bacterium]MDH4034603.1 hypothetical protein [candidate division Zixibacteria bacterium]